MIKKYKRNNEEISHDIGNEKNILSWNIKTKINKRTKNFVYKFTRYKYKPYNHTGKCMNGSDE